MMPQFPSYTFTNHYSLMTGLLPIHHGIVANRFYDSDLKREFILNMEEIRIDKTWWSAEPVTINSL